MSLLFGAVMIFLIPNITLGKTSKMFSPAKLQTLGKHYKDVFIPGAGGKPSLGSSSATCWKRGGICVDIMRCPGLRMDIAVPGCAWGFKVCCVVQKMLSPTAGVVRRAQLPLIGAPEDLGTNLIDIAQSNYLSLALMGDTGDDQTED